MYSDSMQNRTKSDLSNGNISGFDVPSSSTMVEDKQQTNHLKEKDSQFPMRRRQNNNKSNGSHQSMNYDKTLDDWLENCMKNPSSYLASSTELLEAYQANTTQYRNSGPFMMRPDPINYGPTKYLSGTHYLTSMPPGQTTHLIDNQNTEFASLPPNVNHYSTNGPEKTGSQELLDCLEPRRYSDPCLAAVPLQNDSKLDNQSKQSVNEPAIDNTKLLKTLIDQINVLHETNSKICRNLHNTRVDIEALKHAPSWGLRHRRDSISGLSTHSQPLGYATAFGAASPAPTYHSGMYTPGMMTDVVREVKEAARIREEALLSRVRALVEERSWSLNDTNLKVMRDMDEMKLQVHQLRTEKQETSMRITKLEDEVKSLRSILSHVINYNHHNSRQPAAQQHIPSDQNAQKRNSFYLNYGTINHDDGFPTELDNVRPINVQCDVRKMDKLKYNGKNSTKHNNGQNGISQRYSLDRTHEDESHLVQIEKETLELRRELQDAKASRKQAEHKISTLEQMVKSLQSKIPDGPSPSQSKSITNINGSNPISHQHHPNLNNQSISEITILTSPNNKSQLDLTPSPKLLSTSTICLTGPVTDL